MHNWKDTHYETDMESNKSEVNDITESVPMEVELEKSTENLVISDDTVAPVIIEELDENAISSMDMDLNEFVEAQALQIQEVKEIPNTGSSCRANKDTDTEDQMSLTPDEEDQLTKQFLNGELTFSEYSSKMDQDIDMETLENDNIRYDSANTVHLFSSSSYKIIFNPTFRKNTEIDRVAVQKIKQKSHKTSNVQQVRQKKKRRILPPVLQGLMGEANLRYAKGEVDLAGQICMEIIRQVLLTYYIEVMHFI